MGSFCFDGISIRTTEHLVIIIIELGIPIPVLAYYVICKCD